MLPKLATSLLSLSRFMMMGREGEKNHKGVGAKAGVRTLLLTKEIADKMTNPPETVS